MGIRSSRVAPEQGDGDGSLAAKLVALGVRPECWLDGLAGDGPAQDAAARNTMLCALYCGGMGTPRSLGGRTDEELATMASTREWSTIRVPRPEAMAECRG